jgi:two-component system sensor histidine kinase KdpD
LDKSTVLDDAKKMQLYQSIYNDSLWLNSVVENILSITQIEDGKMRLNLQAELLNEVIEEALAHIAVNTDHHVIHVHVVDELLMASMELKLILQVIINLVENAIKYTPPGTEIVITAKRVNQKVVVQIADNGNGIPDDKKERVFDIFYSGSKSYGESRSGLGLGLACCKAILSAHEEDIYILDNIPQGTIFEFTLKAVEVDSYE